AMSTARPVLAFNPNATRTASTYCERPVSESCMCGAAKLRWYGQSFAPCLLDSSLVIHVGSEKLHLLSRSLCREQLITSDLSASNCDNRAAVLDHRFRGRRQPLGTFEVTAPGVVFNVEDVINIRGKSHLVAFRLRRHDSGCDEPL